MAPEALFGVSLVLVALWVVVGGFALPPMFRSHPGRSPLLMGLLLISALEVCAAIVLLETAGHAFGSNRVGVHQWSGPFTLRGINAAIAVIVYVMIRKARH